MKKKWFRISGRIEICFTGTRFPVNHKLRPGDYYIQAISKKQAKVLFVKRFAKLLGYGVHAVYIENTQIREVNETEKSVFKNPKLALKKG